MAGKTAKATLSAEQKAHNKKQLWVEIKKHRLLYVFMLPCLVSLIVFAYIPMGGVVLAFKNYRFDLGIYGSEWAGFKHFKAFLTSPEFWTTTKNTLIISILKIVICFPAPIILALLLNEVRAKKYKSVIQTMSYLPNFVSWAVVVTLLTVIFSPYGGIYNDIRKSMGLDPIFVLGEKGAFYPLVILTDIWKNVGWSSIVYLSAITGVDQGLYEAATIDGANRWQCTWHVTIPGIATTIGILFIMRMGGILGADMDQLLLLQQPANMQLSQVLDTYILQTGIRYGKFEYATAIGLVRSVISLGLVTLTNHLSSKYADMYQLVL